MRHLSSMDHQIAGAVDVVDQRCHCLAEMREGGSCLHLRVYEPAENAFRALLNRQARQSRLPKVTQRPLKIKQHEFFFFFIIFLEGRVTVSFNAIAPQNFLTLRFYCHLISMHSLSV